MSKLKIIINVKKEKKKKKSLILSHILKIPSMFLGHDLKNQSTAFQTAIDY